MKLENLPKRAEKAKKRLGRGYGSGKGGHTVGRGQKGQKSRSKIPLLFEGTKVKKSLVKRLPLLRGKGKFKTSGKKPVIVNLKFLNLLPEGAEVTAENLVRHGLVEKEQAKAFGVKILGEGEIARPLTVKLPVSRGARKKIEKAGGKVVEAVKTRKKTKPGKRKSRKPKKGVKKSKEETK